MTTLRFDWLQALPAYWRGRAETRIRMCNEALRNASLTGDRFNRVLLREEAMKHAQQANEYEIIADWLGRKTT